MRSRNGLLLIVLRSLSECVGMFVRAEHWEIYPQRCLPTVYNIDTIEIETLDL